MPLIQTAGLIKEYVMGANVVHALRGVNLTIAEGELVVLLGPSGSGKSTLLNVLGGLDRPTAGDTFFRDLNLSTATDAEVTAYRRLHVGFVSRRLDLDYFHCGLVVVEPKGPLLLRHAAESRHRVLDERMDRFLARYNVRYVTLLRPEELAVV